MIEEEKVQAHIKKKKAEMEYKDRKMEEFDKFDSIGNYIISILLFPIFAIPIVWLLLPKQSVYYWRNTMALFCTEAYIKSHVDDVIMFTEALAKHISDDRRN